MDADVVAAIAALVVAFIALLVASAQAIQQYLVSGQLIRLCDSVVYNGMPGQGHRVHLLPDLWSGLSSSNRALSKDAASLPNLKAASSGGRQESFAGEASWVSFVRAVQHSSGLSLRYVMIEGDADRCPSDLPVVPMQLSMRDVIVVAMMAGMECTDISFQSQSLSMQGDVGTITTSRHPVLGALLHFAPKQNLEDHGIRTSKGRVNDGWVARMLDIVTVAGQRYDLRDRKHFEEDEGSWIKATNVQSIPPSGESPISFPAEQSSQLRKRRAARSPGHEEVSQLSKDQKDSSMTQVRQQPQDGQWELTANERHHITIKNVTPGDSEWPVVPAVKLPGSRFEFLRPVRERIAGLHPRVTPQDRTTILPLAELTHNTSHSRNSLKANIVPSNAGPYETLPQASTNYSLNGASQRTMINGKTINQGSVYETDTIEILSQPSSQRTQLGANRPRQEAAHQSNHQDSSQGPPQLLLQDVTTSSRPSEAPLNEASRDTQKDARNNQTSLEDYWGKMEQQDSSTDQSHLSRLEPIQRGRRRDSELAWNVRLKGERAFRVSGLERTAHPHKTRSAQNSSLIERTGNSPGRRTVRLLTSAEVIGDDGETGPIRSPQSPRPTQDAGPAKPALRRPRSQFPEEPNFVRPGVASAADSRPDKGVPQSARYTKIHRRLVDVEVLEETNERYEVLPEHVIVLRVLTRAEIEQYAARTQEIRESLMKAVVVRDRSPDTSDNSWERPKPLRQPSLDSDASPVKSGALEHDTSQGAYSTSYPANRDSSSSDSKEKFLNRDSHGNDWKQPSSISDYLQTSEGSGDSDTIYRTRKGQRRRRRGRTRMSGSHDGTRSQPYRRSSRALSSNRVSSLDIGILTYDEELLMIHSDDVLKKLKGSTELCKDVATTLQFTMSIQPELGNMLLDIESLIRDINSSIKSTIMTVEPSAGDKKIAGVITSELEVLQLGLQASLDVFQKHFDLFDITPMKADVREKAWKRALGLFNKRYSCSMMEHLTGVRNYSTEVASNFQAGVFTSEETKMLKYRLMYVIGMRTFPPEGERPRASRSIPISQSRASYFHSPKRYTSSPSGSADERYIDYSISRNGPVESVPQYPRFPRSRTRQTYSYDTYDPIKSSYIDDYPYEEDMESSEATLTSWNNDVTGEMKWFWICQADILPGYFATPWKSLFSSTECIGAISVYLKSLEHFTDNSNLRYVPSHPDCEAWLRTGRTTYPSYAHNSNGGVIVTGAYPPTHFRTFKIEIAPLELLHSYDHQVSHLYSPSTASIIATTAELAYLDTWLSFAGRLPEIIDGANTLLRNLPTLIQQIMLDFHLEFNSVDRTSKDGGQVIIKTISDSLMTFLEERGLNEAERFFAVVAVLRTAKMGLAVARGVDTEMVREVLVKDVQVYMA
ncbi:MAG: hypothetical protein Q9220_005495 [cf. Caloplaca sp. 1 TL-2023]